MTKAEAHALALKGMYAAEQEWTRIRSLPTHRIKLRLTSVSISHWGVFEL